MSADRDPAARADPGDQPAHGGAGRRGRRGAWWLSLLLVLVLYLGAGAILGGQDALEAIAAARPWPLVAATALQGIVVLTWANVHRAGLRAVGGRIAYRQALQVSMSAFTVSHTVPGGGVVAAAVAVHRLRHFGVSAPTAAASSTLTAILSLLTIALLGAVGIARAVILDDLGRAVLVPTGAALSILTAIVVGILVALRSPATGDRIIDLLGRAHHRLRRHAEEWSDSWHAVTEHAPEPRDIARVVAWSGLKWSADIGSMALVFLAFDQPAALGMLLVAFGASQLLAAIPSTPGGTGLIEGGLIGVYAAFGVPLAIATTVTLVYRVIEAWLPTLAGVPVLLRVPNGD